MSLRVSLQHLLFRRRCATDPENKSHIIPISFFLESSSFTMATRRFTSSLNKQYSCFTRMDLFSLSSSASRCSRHSFWILYRQLKRRDIAAYVGKMLSSCCMRLMASSCARPHWPPSCHSAPHRVCHPSSNVRCAINFYQIAC